MPSATHWIRGVAGESARPSVGKTVSRQDGKSASRQGRTTEGGADGEMAKRTYFGELSESFADEGKYLLGNSLTSEKMTKVTNMTKMTGGRGRVVTTIERVEESMSRRQV